MQDLIVVGAGGHAKVVLDALSLLGRYRVVGLIGRAEEAGSEVLGTPVIGTDADLASLHAGGIMGAVLGIGSVGDPSARIAAATALRAEGFHLPPIVHPTAAVSPRAELADGVFIAAGAVVAVDASIGACAIVNSGAVVDHDCVVGEFAHISPGVSLSGGVRIGDRTHVGTGSSVAQYVSIGADVLLGAGSVVVDDIEDGVVAYGNPARVIRSRD